MHTLIHNTVTTDRGRYTFKTREEAEAFFIAATLRERARQSPDATSRLGAGNPGRAERREKARSRHAS
ncbi:MAG: hypothetical protein QJR02_08775 [Sinobacteraceae bacterium]|nr:hypothetical protein [Nevskiaceae bacterium]